MLWSGLVKFAQEKLSVVTSLLFTTLISVYSTKLELGIMDVPSSLIERGIGNSGSMIGS